MNVLHELDELSSLIVLNQNGRTCINGLVEPVERARRIELIELDERVGLVELNELAELIKLFEVIGPKNGIAESLVEMNELNSSSVLYYLSCVD